MSAIFVKAKRSSENGHTSRRDPSVDQNFASIGNRANTPINATNPAMIQFAVFGARFLTLGRLFSLHLHQRFMNSCVFPWPRRSESDPGRTIRNLEKNKEEANPS